MIVKNVEKKENSTATIQVEVEAEVFENAVNSAYKRMKGSIFVAGFRKGKAPRSVIEGMYGKEVFHDEAVQIIARDAFDFGVEESKLEVVGMPAIQDYEVGEDRVLNVTFVTELYPEVSLGQYKGLEAEYSEPSVSDAQVDDEIAAARKRNARLVDVERPVQSGDSIVLDFEGFVDGEAFEGGKAEGYTLEIGSGSFIPGFEDGLIGMAPESEGEVHVTFPEQYDEKLAGREATFKVRVHTIREAQLPELDDEFAKDVSEFDTLEEYKADVRAKLLANATEQAESAFKSSLMNQALENMSAEVPEALVNEKMDEFLRSYADSMGLRGNISRAELIKALGMGEETFVQMIRPSAIRQVQADLLLDKIVEEEKIEISQEDKDEFYKKLEEDYGEQAAQVREMIDESLMQRDLARRKAADAIYSTAVKTEPKPEQAEAAEEAEAQED